MSCFISNWGWFVRGTEQKGKELDVGNINHELQAKKEVKHSYVLHCFVHYLFNQMSD